MRYAREQRVPARRCGIVGEELRERPVRSPEHAFLVERGPDLDERMTGDPGAYGVPERFACPEPAAPVFQDRTSVVYGKRVSVHVDLGGPRLIKKHRLSNNMNREL